MSQIEPGAIKRWTPCYCGGQILEVFQRRKIVYFGAKPYTYVKPRWQIVNCYSKKDT